jgi:hypothetical protein
MIKRYSLSHHRLLAQPLLLFDHWRFITIGSLIVGQLPIEE